jgi:hypothetical protein
MNGGARQAPKSFTGKKSAGPLNLSEQVSSFAASRVNDIFEKPPTSLSKITSEDGSRAFTKANLIKFGSIPSKVPPPYSGPSPVDELSDTTDEGLYPYLLGTGIPNSPKQQLIDINFTIPPKSDESFIDPSSGEIVRQDATLPEHIIDSLRQHANRPERYNTIASGTKPIYSTMFRTQIRINPTLEQRLEEDAARGYNNYSWRAGNDVPIAVIVQAQRHVLFIVLYGGMVYSIGIGGGPDGQVVINTPDWFDGGTRRIIDVCIFKKIHMDRLKAFLSDGIINPEGPRMRLRFRQGMSGGSIFDCTQILTGYPFSYLSGDITSSFNCAKFVQLIFNGRINCSAVATIRDPDSCLSSVCGRGGECSLSPAQLIRVYILMKLAGSLSNDDSKYPTILSRIGSFLFGSPASSSLDLNVKHDAMEKELIKYLLLGTTDSTSLLPDVDTFIRLFWVPDPRGIVPGVASAAQPTSRGGRRKSRKTRKIRKSRSNRRQSRR